MLKDEKKKNPTVNRSFFYPRVSKPVSLIGYGANRYLNMGLQALSACPIFIAKLIKLQLKYPNLAKLRTFNYIIKFCLDNRGKSWNLSEDQIFQFWNRPGQQDSYDLLAYVINDIYDEVKNEIIAPLDSKEKFEYKLPMRVKLEITRCSKCYSEKSIQFDFALHIPIIKIANKDSIVLQDLIENYFNRETTNTSLSNEKCNGNCSKAQIKLCTLPNTLCIHLERYYCIDKELQINKDMVIFKEEIIIQQSYLSKGLAESSSSVINNQIYHLKSVITENPNDICYKLLNNNWLCVADSSIRKADLNEIFKCKVYILFYEKYRPSHTNIVQNSQRTQSSINLSHRVGNYENISRIDGIPKCYKPCIPIILLKSEYSNLSHSKLSIIRKSRASNLKLRLLGVSENSKSSSISQLQFVLIEAFSSCRYFVESLKLVNCENIEEQYLEILKFILNAPVFPNRKRIIKDNNLDILGNFENFLNATFKELNTSTIEMRNEKKVQCPISIPIMSEVECKCNRTSFNIVNTEFGLKVTNFTINIQRSIDAIFNSEKEILLNEKNAKCNCTTGDLKYRLLRHIPKTICVYTENECCLFGIKSLKKIVLKNAFFTQSQNNTEDNLEKEKQLKLDKNEYEYYLKSIICSAYDGFECYRICNGVWYHIKDNQLKIIEESSNLFGKWHILLYDTFKEAVQLKCKNIESKVDNVNQNDEFYSETRIEKAMMRNLLEFQCSKRNCSNRTYCLQIFMHAVSACQKFVNGIQNIVTCEMKKSNLFLKYIPLSLQALESTDIPLEVVNELLLSEESNMFLFLRNLLLNLSHEWKVNPFQISKHTVIKCSQCGTVIDAYIDSKISFNIPITNSDENIDIQDFVDNNFQIQYLKDFDCSSTKCLGNEGQRLSKLSLPIPKVICIHIESVILDGKNIVRSAKIQIPNRLQLKNEYLYSQAGLNTKNKDSFYILQSIISTTVPRGSVDYCCYKRINEVWYKISRSLTCPVTEKERFHCKPYIIFYELLDE